MLLAFVASASLCQAQATTSTTTASTGTTPPTEPVVELERMVVSGIRSSLTQALDIKRESVQIVDSIVAEDIGKFPDNNLVEALQRVSGIQVTNRGAGEVATVSIRGLNDINTTLNGQNIFTASGQSVALQDIPASLLSRVDVYKTRSADLIETGIAGVIDIRTHRPFDFKGRKVVLAARGIYQEQADRVGSNLSALISDRWDTSVGKVGALFNLSFVKTPYRDQNVTAGAEVPFVTANPPAPYVPYERIFPTRAGVAENPIWQAGLEEGLPFKEGSTLKINGQNVPYILSRDAIFQNDFTGTRERPAANLVLQWAPDKTAEYTFEALYDGYRNTSFNNLFFSFVDGWWNLGANPSSTITLFPGTNIVKSRSFVGDVYNFTSGDATHGETDSQVYTLSGKWELSDQLKLRSAYTYQHSTFQSEFFAVRAERNAPSISADFNSGGGLPAFSFGDNPNTTINEANLADPNLWTIAQLYDNANRNKGSANTFTIDGDYKPNCQYITGIKFGGRYDVRKASEADRTTQNPGWLGAPLGNYPELWHVNHDFFDGHSNVPRSWVVPNGLELYDNADKYRALWIAKFPNDYKLGKDYSLFKTFDVRETNTAAYLRGDFKTFIGNRKLDGQVGVRYVSVKTDMHFTDRGTLVTSAASVSKEKALPSGSLRFAITESLIARASYAETLRRPNFVDLNPAINYVKDVTNIGYGTASGGNPNLRPTESKNYDLSLEYYFGKSSAVYATLFKRKIDGLVVSFRKRVRATAPGDTAPYDYILTQPDNASNGELEGFELGAVYFPDNLPGLLQGLGVQASFTSLDSQQDIPVTNDTGQVTSTLTRDFFQVSDKSYSVVLAYERPKYSARLSYVWRSAFLNNYEAALFANPLGIYRKPEESLDFQLTYRLLDNLVLTFDATNLTEEIYQSYYKYADLNPFGSSLYSRTFAIGARYSF